MTIELLAQLAGGEKEHQRRDDAGVDDEGIGGLESPGAAAFLDDRAERAEHVTRVPQGAGVDVLRPFGDFAEPDAGEVRARLTLDGNRLDEAADLVLGGRAGACHLAHARADGVEHVADDLAIEGGLAAEVVVDHRLVDAGGAGDAVDVGAGVAAGGELRGGGVQQRPSRIPHRRRRPSGHC